MSERTGRLRRVLNARMEEMSFRSGVAIGAGVLAFAGAAIVLTVTLGAGHPAVAAPSAASYRAVPSSASPSASPYPGAAAAPYPSASASPIQEASVAADVPELGITTRATSAQASPPPSSLGPRPRRHRRRPLPVASPTATPLPPGFPP